MGRLRAFLTFLTFGTLLLSGFTSLAGVVGAQTSNPDSGISCKVGRHPYGIAFDSANGLMYVANALSNTVSVIKSPCAVVKTISLGSPLSNAFNSAYIAYDPVNGFVYVSDVGFATVVVINGMSILGTITGFTGHNATGLAADPVGGDVFAVDFGGQVSVISGLSVVDQISIASTGGGVIAYGAGTMFVSTPFSIVNDNKVFEIGVGCLCVKGSLTVKGSDSQGISYNPSNGFLYVSDFKKGLVQVFNPTTGKMKASIPLRANGPIGVAFDPNNDDIYVAEFCHACLVHSNITVISGLSVVRTIQLSSGPFYLAYSAVNQMMYVTLSGKTVTLVS